MRHQLWTVEGVGASGADRSPRQCWVSARAESACTVKSRGAAKLHSAKIILQYVISVYNDWYCTN